MYMDGNCRAERIKALTSYLKAVPSAEVEPSAVGTIIVDDSVVKLIEQEVTRASVSLVHFKCNLHFLPYNITVHLLRAFILEQIG